MKIFNNLLSEITLGRAAVFANTAHQGQYRKSSGAPYIVHPTAVLRIIQKLGIKEKNILVAAFLHDTIEDSKISYNDIKREFNKEIADLVREVTSIKKDLEREGKAEYLSKKMIKMTSGALIIKLADRIQNFADISTMPKAWVKKYTEQTLFILQNLETKRKLNKFHKKLIKQIYAIIDPYINIDQEI